MQNAKCNNNKKKKNEKQNQKQKNAVENKINFLISFMRWESFGAVHTCWVQLQNGILFRPRVT